MDERIRDDWQGKRVAVIGLGISNTALIKFLAEAGAEISARDQKTRAELGEGAAGSGVPGRGADSGPCVSRRVGSV